MDGMTCKRRALAFKGISLLPRDLSFPGKRKQRSMRAEEGCGKRKSAQPVFRNTYREHGGEEELHKAQNPPEGLGDDAETPWRSLVHHLA